MPGGGSKPGERRGGRKPGSRNLANRGVRELARGFLDDPDYLAALKDRLMSGTAGAVELRLWDYGYGRPVPDSGDGAALLTSITIRF